MKKILIVSFLFVYAIASVEVKGQAQQLIKKGNVDAALSLGFGGVGYLGSGFVLPATAMVEVGLNDHLSIGGVLGVTRYGVDDLTYTYTVFGPRASYHFADYIDGTPDNVDLYGGLGLYYSVPSNSEGKLISAVFLPALHVGGNYFFYENWAVNVELGYSNAWAKVGILRRI